MELTGKRILVVEDDYYLADALCQDLREHGAVVLGPAPTPFYAFQLLGRRGVDGAVLDVKLHGTTVFGLADELCRRGTPILFATAYGEEVIPERFRGRPRISKPYDTGGLLRALAALQPAGQGPSGPAASADGEEPRPSREDSHLRMMRAIAAAMRQNAAAAATRPARAGADRPAKSPPEPATPRD